MLYARLNEKFLINGLRSKRTTCQMITFSLVIKIKRMFLSILTLIISITVIFGENFTQVGIVSRQKITRWGTFSEPTLFNILQKLNN